MVNKLLISHRKLIALGYLDLTQLCFLQIFGILPDYDIFIQATTQHSRNLQKIAAFLLEASKTSGQ